jgi:hypothetical protein
MPLCCTLARYKEIDGKHVDGNFARGVFAGLGHVEPLSDTFCLNLSQEPRQLNHRICDAPIPIPTVRQLTISRGGSRTEQSRNR